MDDDELPCFVYDLSGTTNDGANFRFENDPANPYERTNIIERRGLLHVRCTVRDIVHGQWSEENDDEATLLVLLFRFDADDLGRRIKLARIKLTFSGSSPDHPDPEVARLWPDKTYSIFPTTRSETVCTGARGSLSVGAEVGAELSCERTKTVQRELQSVGIVRGSADTQGRNFGLHNSASWTLMENPDTHSGVAAAMQCAVLVRRRVLEEPFAATVQITVHAGRPTAAREWIRGVFSQPRKVDPILFDPKRPPTNRLRVYDDKTRAALGTIKLDDPSLTDITLRNVWNAADKQT
ncbi:hypothetical protein BBK36DRAFT_1121510 [Trichoderma citrinoviride]|uniref:Uncharacterized protein n=1 Tax=Trichoderma citrinoviride TaxID=58853 RepID=A0A2T4B718_9HYPO|nr:hypothetical protein BBK36DRAFT_1121510 [Trichoderma citrinoviride]PTB65122.1 hypothetical protein BBK36DRAFT_1121510 [Trichoderma citrinoviride]